MAQYIKFRLTAAKVGVSMALAALIAGIAEKVQSSPLRINATEASSSTQAHQAAQVDFFGKHIKGLSPALTTALLAVENKDKSFVKKMNTLQLNLTKLQKADGTFLKTDKANQTFLAISDYKPQFNFLNGQLNNLSGGLQTLSSAVNNLPNEYLQGRGSVANGALTLVNDGTSHQLASTPDGAISVLVALTPGNGPTLNLKNNTGELIPAVQDISNSNGSQTKEIQLSPGDNPVSPGPGTTQFHLQTFPGQGGGTNGIIAVLISLTPNPSNSGQYLASGQLLGNL